MFVFIYLGFNVTFLFVYLGFYVAFNTVQVISRRVVGRAEETNTYSSLGLCTVNCRPTASNYQLSHLRSGQELNPNLRVGRRECYHCTTVAPLTMFEFSVFKRLELSQYQQKNILRDWSER